MRLAVILLNWRDWQKTLRCARRILAWDGLKPELIVVDNESNAASRAALDEALPPATVVASPVNRGYGGGNNLGLAAAFARGAEYILLLNSDAEISEDAANALLARLDANIDIAVIGPAIRERRGGKVECLVGGRDIASHVSTHERVAPATLRQLAYSPLREVDYVPGTVLLARRTLFAKIGDFDERYFFSGEAADLCKRARDAGARVCIDLSVEAEHDTALTPDALRRTLYLYYSLRNRFLYVRKHHADKRVRYMAFWTKIGAAEIARALSRGRLGEARAVALALADGWSGRYGNRNARFVGQGVAAKESPAEGARDVSPVA